MKLRKRIAAVAAAMVMATSMMMTSASAASDNLSVTYITSVSSGYRNLEADVRNNSSLSRLVASQAHIYNTSNTNTAAAAESSASKVVGNGDRVYSGNAKYNSSNAVKGKATGVLYNGNVVQSGQYDSKTVIITWQS